MTKIERFINLKLLVFLRKMAEEERKYNKFYVQGEYEIVIGGKPVNFNLGITTASFKERGCPDPCQRGRGLGNDRFNRPEISDKASLL